MITCKPIPDPEGTLHSITFSESNEISEHSWVPMYTRIRLASFPKLFPVMLMKPPSTGPTELERAIGIGTIKNVNGKQKKKKEDNQRSHILSS